MNDQEQLPVPPARHAAFPHFAAIFGPAAKVAFVVSLVVLVVVSRPPGADVPLASAVAGEYLQIAPQGTSDFADSVDGTWTMTRAVPGDTVAGGVLLRTTTSVDPAHASLVLSERLDGTGDPDMLSHLFVTAMSYNGADVLPEWNACAVGGHLTIGGLAACPAQTLLPVPAPGGGTPFEMTVEFDPDAPNRLQGKYSGVFTLVFTLTDTTPEGNGDSNSNNNESGTNGNSTYGSGGNSGTGTGTAVPTEPTASPPAGHGGASPSATPSAPRTDTVAGVRSPGPGNGRVPTPLAPSTGSGASQTGRSLLGFVAALAGLVLGLSSATGWLVRRRQG